MDIDDVRTLYAYNLWASRRLFSALEKLSDAQFTAEAEGQVPSIRKTVRHLFGGGMELVAALAGRIAARERPQCQRFGEACGTG